MNEDLGGRYHGVRNRQEFLAKSLLILLVIVIIGVSVYAVVTSAK